MAARHCFCELGETVDDNQDSSVAIVRETIFQMIKLNQLVDITTLDVFLSGVVHRRVYHVLVGKLCTGGRIAQWFGVCPGKCDVLEFLPILMRYPGVPLRFEQYFMLV